MTSQEKQVTLDSTKDQDSVVPKQEDGASDVGSPPEGDSAPSSTAPAPEPVLVPKTEEAGNRFLRRWQIWDATDGWVPYDPSTYVPPPPLKEDPNNFFYVNIRYQRADASPDHILSDFSKTLTHFLRSFIGNPFFSSRPILDIEKLFPLLKKLKSKLATTEQLLSASDIKEEVIRSTANSLGCTKATYSTEALDHVRQYLTDLAEHLAVLVAVVEEEFKPTADRLALLVSYGQIEFDLLTYYFDEGQKYSTTDNGDSIAFVLTEKYYYHSDSGKYFVAEGRTKSWNGSKYTLNSIQRNIKSFQGTMELSSLSFKSLTSELQAKLTERGRLYTTLSGMHYKSYLKSRVIVDRLAYDNRQGFTRSPDVKIPALKDDDLCLLPAYVYGFNLKKKVWDSFHVESIRPVEFDEKAWDHLVLDEDTKTLVKALVEVTKNKNTSSTIISDVISGKGGGLISVLHGPPGTGKTLTAEALAEHLQRPLYMVGSSELSTRPVELESNLKAILSLASAWDAVLLIDEADVFLEQRSLHELERNALVSVALRLLEYHRGVLFLTTNRIKTFDEAFLSRFSIAIKYPELDQASRLIIWRKFFEFAESQDEQHSSGENSPKDVVKVEKDGSTKEVCAISLDDLDELAAKPFNGRTIKNLVRTAQALALSRNEQLSVEHVKMVVRVQEKFLDEFAQFKL